ncbi:hypothetical protein BT96DRAFT_764988, partial [Gymnopus androsaceus JB14]
TVDTTEENKADIKKNHANSAAGLDQVHYKDIIAMDSELLNKLINDYRAVGLESCMLKFVTLLIMKRFVNWAKARKIIPPPQNGFRKGYRTNNNTFILRAAMEKAKFMGKTLWVASIDITNAFPSVDRSTLWQKLQELGASGKLLD